MGRILTTLIVVLILIAPFGWSAEEKTENPAQPKNFLDTLASCVVMVRGVGRDGRPSAGTAFLLSSDKNLYLVTAGHVADTLGTKSSITIRTLGDKPYNLELGQLSGEVLNWNRSPDSDIAILVLHPVKEIDRYLNQHFAPVSLLEFEEIAPPRDAVLTILGFPLALGVHESFSPIARETKAASGLLTIPKTGKSTRFFLTQDPSIGGFSGSPLFDLKTPIWTPPRSIQFRGGGPQIVGVAIATISDETGGKLGLIVPAFYVARVLKALGETFPQPSLPAASESMPSPSGPR